MNSKIYLIEDKNSQDTVCIHPIKAKRMKIKEGTGTLKFGIQTITLKIIITTTHNVNELFISSNIIKSFKIPLFCEFDFINDQQNLMIGPFIGIVAARSKNTLNKKLDEFSDYLYHYDQIGGAIMIFSLDQVSPKEQMIQGFMFNPANKRWEKGMYNYPSSLLLRIRWFGSKWQRHFESFMGDTIFNNFHYNKWSIHKYLINTSDLTNHLPKTTLYTKPSDVLSFLEKYSSAYLKPIDLSRGRGIMKIDLRKNGLQVKYINGSEVIQETLNNEDMINDFFSQKLKPKGYIIQKTIDLVTKNTSIIDFRIYLTKDGTEKWKNIGIFSKQGMPGQIVSNAYQGGKYEKGLQILKDTLHLSDHEVKEIEDSINNIALKAVKTIENSGVHFANTAIDIAIDKNKKIWIIEIQHCVPAYEVTNNETQTLLYEYLNMIMRYAKKLAGF